jgi:hypothetical protein
MRVIDSILAPVLFEVKQLFKKRRCSFNRMNTNRRCAVRAVSEAALLLRRADPWASPGTGRLRRAISCHAQWSASGSDAVSATVMNYHCGSRNLPEVVNAYFV